MKKKQKTLVFSEASFSSVQSYLEALGIPVWLGDPSTIQVRSAEFAQFKWPGDEKHYATASALEHCTAELKKFGVRFERGYRHMYDVHSSSVFLSVEDEKVGKLSGETDGILGPFGVALETVAKVSCVAFELKTDACINEKGFGIFSAQATLELIASCYHSDQRALVVLTDLFTEACLFTVSKVAADESVVIQKYENVTLNQRLRLLRIIWKKIVLPIVRK
jgi:hypothetical protein